MGGGEWRCGVRYWSGNCDKNRLELLCEFGMGCGRDIEGEWKGLRAVELNALVGLLKARCGYCFMMQDQVN